MELPLRLGPPGSCPSLPFLGKGSPTKIDYRKKLVPFLTNLSTGVFGGGFPYQNRQNRKNTIKKIGYQLLLTSQIWRKARLTEQSDDPKGKFWLPKPPGSAGVSSSENEPGLPRRRPACLPLKGCGFPRLGGSKDPKEPKLSEVSLLPKKKDGCSGRQTSMAFQVSGQTGYMAVLGQRAVGGASGS